MMIVIPEDEIDLHCKHGCPCDPTPVVCLGELEDTADGVAMIPSAVVAWEHHSLR